MNDSVIISVLPPPNGSLSVILKVSFQLFKSLNISIFKIVYLKTCVPAAQWLEHCVSSSKVVGSIPGEHTLTIQM